MNVVKGRVMLTQQMPNGLGLGFGEGQPDLGRGSRLLSSLPQRQIEFPAPRRIQRQPARLSGLEESLGEGPPTFPAMRQ